MQELTLRMNLFKVCEEGYKPVELIITVKGSAALEETVVITGDHVRIEFVTNASSNDSYGFKATITPNFD